MARRIQRRDEDLEINMTPMLDIVFIMLIFFIVTAVFVKQAGVEVDKPAALTAQDVRRISILIAVTESGEVWINKRAVDVRDVSAVVEKLHRENPKGRIVIQADRDSTSGLVVDIMDQLSDLGVSGVAISTLEAD